MTPTQEQKPFPLDAKQQADVDRICAHMGCEPVYEGPAVRGRVVFIPMLTVVIDDDVEPRFGTHRCNRIHGDRINVVPFVVYDEALARSYAPFIQDNIEGVAL